MAYTSSTDYSLWPTDAPSNPTPCGRPHVLVGKITSITSAASQVPTNARTKNGVSQLLEQRQFAEYQKSLSITPIVQRANHSPLPIPVGPPPSFPSRCPVDSTKKSDAVPSTVSRNGITRIQRTASDGSVILQPDERSLFVQVTQPKPSRSTDSSPKPPRQSISRNSFETPSALTCGSGMRNGVGVENGNKSPLRSVHCAAEKPQLRRRPSVDISESSRHRRSHSADVPRGDRLCRSTSNSSLTSYALDSEAVKMLPDPRWGGGVSSIARSRSFSSENIQSMVSTDIDSSSSPDSSTPFGSIMGTDNKLISSVIVSTPIVYQQPKIQLSRSDVSNSSFSSGVSIDRSVEPVMTDMTKSAMFKGITNKGIVKLQLPKDNFRLLSDRDLESGCVYKRTLVENEDDYFHDYHITIGGAVDSSLSNDCQYTSMNCDTVQGPPKQLPPAYYVMAVDADIYQRMFDEVSESMNMPCGLFYCGHHDDVHYPSIRIAMAGVMITLSVMLVATICVGG